MQTIKAADQPPQSNIKITWRESRHEMQQNCHLWKEKSDVYLRDSSRRV